MTEQDSDIAQFADLIRQLKSADVNHRVFGSKKHQYRLGPVLSESDVSDFERRHGVALPDDYRQFLTEVGNGGAGPMYGIFPLKADDYRDLAKPFPFTVATVDMPEEVTERFGYWEDYPGILEICDVGSGISVFLVVNGPTYGTVWDGWTEFHPKRQTFGVWYRQWAEQALRSLANEALVPRLRVGMSKADVLAEVGGDWQIRKALDRAIWFMESSDIPAQLELDEQEIVVKINPSLFI